MNGGPFPDELLPIWNVHIEVAPSHEGGPEAYFIVFREPVTRTVAFKALERIENAMNVPTVGELSLTKHAVMIPDDRGDVLLVPLRLISIARVVRVEEP